MATITQQPDDVTSTDQPRPRPASGSRGGRLLKLLVTGGILAGGVAILYPTVASSLSTEDKTSKALTYVVEPEQILVTVTEDGTVESASNVEVKCQISGGSTILWIVDDGEFVEKGDEIVRLDTSSIEDQLNTQKIAYERALATKIQTEESHKAAIIAVKEYAEGTFVQELQVVESEIRIALENLRSAENILAHTERMARKGFVTKLQREADAFAVERAQLDLDAANTRKKVLVNFTKEKTLKDLEAARDAAAAQVRADEAALNLEKSRLERLESQFGNCVILAPQKGMVVYANDNRRRSQTPEVEEGAVVREGQTLIFLPDLSRMQVKVTVHESKVDNLRNNMPARIVIQEQELKGRVVDIANQPEPSHWFSSNVKEYAAIVSIEDSAADLKPGMTAEVEILIASLDETLAVPVSSVVEQRNKFFCWVQKPTGPERRPLKLGLTNDKLIEVIDGVAEGDEVLRNPRAVVAEAREDVELEDRQRDRSQFGSGETGTGGASGETGGGRPGGPGGSRDAAGGAGPGAGGPRGPGGGGPGGQRGARSGGSRFDLMQFDADKDGKVSKEESPEQMREHFDKMDTDGDGFIDKKEIEALKAKFRAAAGQGKPPGGQP